MKTRPALAALLSASLLAPAVSEACTRAVYLGKEGQTVTGRTMDWLVSDMDTNMWLRVSGLRERLKGRYGLGKRSARDST